MSNFLFDRLFSCHEGETKAFLTFADGSQQSYDSFLRQAARFANVIQQLGLVVGDRLAAQIEKSAEGLALYAACIQSGVIFLPLNTAYTASELAYFLQDATPRLFIARPDGAKGLEESAGTIGALLLTLGNSGEGTLMDAVRTAEPQTGIAECGPDDIASIIYTSGTTGRSKGAMLSHDNLASNALTLVDLWGFVENDVLLHALPIYHVHGLFVAVHCAMLRGIPMHFLPRFDAQEVIRHLPSVTVMMGVPTFYTRLMDTPDFTRELCAPIRLFISGSAPLLAQTFEAFFAHTGHRILERYGMSLSLIHI